MQQTFLVSEFPFGTLRTPFALSVRPISEDKIQQRLPDKAEAVRESLGSLVHNAVWLYANWRMRLQLMQQQPQIKRVSHKRIH